MRSLHCAHEEADHHLHGWHNKWVTSQRGVQLANEVDALVGGGVGLSVHAPFRIATEKTVFAMPEVSHRSPDHRCNA